MRKLYFLAAAAMAAFSANAQTPTFSTSATGEPLAEGATIYASEVEGILVKPELFVISEDEGNLTIKVEAVEETGYAADESGLTMCWGGACKMAGKSGDAQYFFVETTADYSPDNENLKDTRIEYFVNDDSNFYCKIKLTSYFADRESDEEEFHCYIVISPNGDQYVAGVNEDSDAPVRYFNLQGMEVNADAVTPGIYVTRQGNTVKKVLINK